MEALFVDDQHYLYSEDMSDLVGYERPDYHLTWVRNVYEALSQLYKKDFDVVFIDLALPWAEPSYDLQEELEGLEILCKKHGVNFNAVGFNVGNELAKLVRAMYPETKLICRTGYWNRIQRDVFDGMLRIPHLSEDLVRTLDSIRSEKD